MTTTARPHSNKAKQTAQTVTIYYKDGRIQDGILKSDLLSEKTLRYIPRSQVHDRRRFSRVPFIKEVKIDQLGIRKTTDISTRGMYIECITPYPLGTILPISFNIGKETLRLEIRVAFNDPGIGMGVEFYRISSAIQLKIEALVHRIQKSTNGNLVKCRRKGSDRREEKKYKLGIRRHIQDRRMRKKTSPSPLEANMSEIKSIFFPRITKNSPHMDRCVIIEFRDGEEIQAMVQDISSEPLGFFADLNVTEDIRYTLYVIKSAVKHIEYIF